MRPVDKGDTPRTFTDHKQALPYLRERIGAYCSYCERHIRNLLAVEHIQPKKHHDDLRLEWRNFLLACVNCNATKGSSDLALEDYYWPDQDNTARAFLYREGGLVQVSNTLPERGRTRARHTLELTGLDRKPGHPSYSHRDFRWEERRKAWDKAQHSRRNLQAAENLSMREQIVETATSEGFWSVWMTVFADDVDMKRRFCEAFPGTAPDCFDAVFNPVPRPGGAL